MTYTEVFQDAAAVDKYADVVYAPGSYGDIVSARQRRYLRALVAREFPYRRPVHHDFACGAGRGLAMLDGLTRQAHGYDTSRPMLERAKADGVLATLHEVPADGPVPTPAPAEGPALVTMLRLLLNVEPAVRERALAFAAAALPRPEAGLLVVENHGNRDSLRRLGARRRAGHRWFAELSHSQVGELLARHGFVIERRRGVTWFPRGWYGRPWLRAAVRPLDALGARLGWLNRYAVTVLYVARRAAPSSCPGR
ncbi:SAM-dependent methyltransferase [Pilimelia columellifera]|uniref:Methyltransferase domain-containing protein n=1 Tax=Pilimelia columellifera subsp. columellifera TaxID=706583 RepID=A0ABP6AV98_9ACTN